MDAKTLCLAALTRGDASGYEIKKTLESPPFSHFQDTGFGSIYPALYRMASEGLVSCTKHSQEKRPDKKVYSVTTAGREVLVAALLEPPAPDRFRSDFLFTLFLGALLPERYLSSVVDERIRFYEEQIAGMQDCAFQDHPGGHAVVHGFGLAIYQAALTYLRENREAVIAGAIDASKIERSARTGDRPTVEQRKTDQMDKAAAATPLVAE